MGTGDRSGHRYGTIVCDLERRRIIELLPDREAATVTTWLKQHPGIEVIARDRGAAYIQAATEGCPNAVQVANRWRLMENASGAFLTAVQQSMPAIQTALDVRVIDPNLLTSAERRQYDGWQRRAVENVEILGMARQGVPIKEIVRRTGRSRKLVRTVVRRGRTDVFRSRMSLLERFADTLASAWKGGCRNGAALWRLVRTNGFRAESQRIRARHVSIRGSHNLARILMLRRNKKSATEYSTPGPNRESGFDRSPLAHHQLEQKSRAPNEHPAYGEARSRIGPTPARLPGWDVPAVWSREVDGALCAEARCSQSSARPRPARTPQPLAATLSCVFVSKSLASWRSCNWLDGSPLTRFTIRPR